MSDAFVQAEHRRLVMTRVDLFILLVQQTEATLAQVSENSHPTTV